MVYLWRAVDEEGEVLDVLVHPGETRRRSETNAQAPEEVAFAPERLVTDDLRSYAAAKGMGSTPGMSAGDGRTIELRIRISRRDGGSARCSGSNRPDQPKSFFPHMPPSTTPLTFNAISRPATRSASSETTRSGRGEPPRQHEPEL